MDDNTIVELLSERSEQGIAELSEKYGALCRRIAFHILKNRLDAEECVNDVFLAVWNTVPPEKPDLLVSYVCRITRNIAVNKYRANTAQKRNSYYDVALEEIENCFPSSDPVEQKIDSDETANKLNAFLASLDRENRILFVRRYWYSDSIDELSALFRMSKHTVSVRLSRIRKKLDEYWKKEDHGNE